CAFASIPPSGQSQLRHFAPLPPLNPPLDHFVNPAFLFSLNKRLIESIELVLFAAALSVLPFIFPDQRDGAVAGVGPRLAGRAVLLPRKRTRLVEPTMPIRTFISHRDVWLGVAMPCLERR
ncbi:MAG: hypothetical protein O7G13_18020, partial [Alphaproteobacteria bacterium]|nr:hypothetical protein [Alphaproteobacteria bacterium]